MQAQIGRWGNSLAVRIPGTYAKDLEWEEGMDLDIVQVKDGLLLKPEPRRPSLKELVALITPENRHGETDWGPAVGAKRGSSDYVPDSGDLVWLSFSPQAGREQAGRRPGLVLSPHFYNLKTGLCVVCPITSQAKGYPFEVTLPQRLAVAGVILSDHLRSADWQARAAAYAGRVPTEVLAQVRALVQSLIHS